MACSIPNDGACTPLIIGGEQIEYDFEVPGSERNLLQGKWAKEKMLVWIHLLCPEMTRTGCIEMLMKMKNNPPFAQSTIYRVEPN
jgi:hypothetical protein